MFGSGGKIKVYGIRIGSKVTWYDSESQRDGALRLVKKAVKKGAPVPKATHKMIPAPKGKIRSKVTPDRSNKCRGGKCSRNGYCTRHAKAEGRGMDSIYTDDGKNRNNARWDEPGHRW